MIPRANPPVIIQGVRTIAIRQDFVEGIQIPRSVRRRVAIIKLIVDIIVKGMVVIPNARRVRCLYVQIKWLLVVTVRDIFQSIGARNPVVTIKCKLEVTAENMIPPTARIVRKPIATVYYMLEVAARSMTICMEERGRLGS